MAPADVYDDDDLYDEEDYEEEKEDELNPEDKAAMEKGTADVKKSLGANSSKVTVKQIQEALWHYYYDVDKSVAYLSKTFIAPPPPKPAPKKAPESKLNEFSFSSSLGLFVRSTGVANGLPPPPPLGPFSYSSMSPALQSEFNDTPWLNTPQSRQAMLIAPDEPQGGLLGGAGEAPKMSKLQALAAARKKKNDEKKEQAKASQTESGMKRLSIADDSQKETTKASPSPAKRLRGSDVPSSSHGTLEGNKTVITPSQTQHTSLSNTERVSTHQESNAASQSSPILGEEEPAAPAPKSAPSAFAKTLFGSAPDSRQANRPDFYAMPYASSSSFLATAFSDPSPDDIVLAAQAKGSNFGGAK